MALPKDAIALNNQSNGLPSDAIPLNNQQQYATQAAQMPTGYTHPNQLDVQYTPKMMGVDSSLNPQLVQQQATAQKIGAAIATPTEQAATQLSSGQNSAARDMATMDMLTGMFRGMSDKYADAYKGGLAGGAAQSELGTLADKGFDFFNWANKDALKAVGGFEAIKNEGITKFNSMYSERLGGGEASSRIFTTLLNLAQKELPDRANPIPSVEGRIQGSMENLTRMINGSVGYLNQYHSSEDLANASPKQLDKWTADAMKNSNNYQISPDVMQGLKTRVDYINRPLDALQNNQGQSHQDIAKQILQQRLKNGQ